jgi:Leucine-rich repeat (LRR) protein
VNWPSLNTGSIIACHMNDRTSIPERHVTFSSSDDRVSGLTFWKNKKIHYLPVEVSKSFPNLKFYAANDCSILAVSKRNFEGLKHLKLLVLNQNQIETIENKTFEGLTSLEGIRLSKH